jgi:hypothetical protein
MVAGERPCMCTALSPHAVGTPCVCICVFVLSRVCVDNLHGPVWLSNWSSTQLPKSADRYLGSSTLCFASHCVTRAVFEPALKLFLCCTEMQAFFSLLPRICCHTYASVWPQVCNDLRSHYVVKVPGCAAEGFLPLAYAVCCVVLCSVLALPGAVYQSSSLAVWLPGI